MKFNIKENVKWHLDQEVNRMIEMEKELKNDPSKLGHISNKALASINIVCFIGPSDSEPRRYFLYECEQHCPAMFSYGVSEGIKNRNFDEVAFGSNQTWQELGERMRGLAMAKVVREELEEAIEMQGNSTKTALPRGRRL